MKSIHSKFALIIFTLFALLASLLGSAVIVIPAYAAKNTGVSSDQLPRPLMTPNAWNALGSGLNGSIVLAIAIDGTDIYVGGDFTDAGGDSNADKIAKWDGNSWSALGTGLNGTVRSIAINGSDIYVGGDFTDAGGDTDADYVAKWNGTSWSALGTGLNSNVHVVAVSGSNVYVGGNFTDASGNTSADYIAKLDGDAWGGVGATPLNSTVYSIFLNGGEVYAGGIFTDAGGDANADKITKWNGSSWSALGGGLSGNVYTVVVSGGDVYAGGEFVDAGGDLDADRIAKWDGTSWSDIGGGLNGSLRAITINGTNIYAGGYFIDAGGDANADYIAKWDGASWSALGTTPLSNAVNRIVINGTDIYVGGQFTNAGGDANADHIARFEIDADAPTVDSFSATSPSTSLDIPITAFTASDNVAVTGYKITESSTPPSAGDAGWSASAPTDYTVSSDGNYTLYPWAKDATGNVSVVYGSPASVNVDTAAPSVTAFSAPSSSNSLTIPITDFTATDNIAVTGYKITESSTPPSAGDSGWTASAPTEYILSGYGSYTLYPWAKDAAGNVSAEYGSPVAGTACLTGTITVTSNADSGAGTLRQALADACSGATINFAADYTITLASQLPAVTTTITINGNGAVNTIIQANASPNTATYRVFEVSSSGDLTLDNLTIRHGNTPLDSGGGVFNGGTLTVTNSTFSGNTASNDGGGISNDGTLTVTNSTFTGNSADGGGGIANNYGGTLIVMNSAFSANAGSYAGGIYNNGTGTVANSTLSGNTASTDGGGISNSSPLTLTNSTLSGNSAGVQGGGIFNESTLNYANTIIANSTNGGDCVNNGGTIGTNTNNLVEDGSCSASLSGDPNLGALADNGGSTQTHALLSGSSAIDAGDDATCAASPVSGLDQRGIARDANCDIGAFESNLQSAPNFVVNTAEDSDDSFCDAFVVNLTDCTLREAINAANAVSGADTITFAGDYTITLDGNQLPAVTSEITINGNGIDNTIIQANASPNTATYRVFQVNASGNLTLDDLTVQNGRCNGSCATSTFNGGGIYNTGDTTLTNSKISNNAAANPGGEGGGVYTGGIGSSLTIINSIFSGDPAVVSQAGGAITNNGGTVAITKSTFSSNYTTNAGGAIYNSGPLTIANSTFSGNTATGNVGGALYNSGTATITNSTFLGNSSALTNGSAINNQGTLNLYNNIIANSGSNKDCYNTGAVSASNNLMENSGTTYTCGLTDGANGNIIGSDPDLGTLTGSPAYFPLNSGSPAIDAGDDTICAAAPVNNESQNGVMRPQGSHCDIGAFEMTIFRLFLPLILR